ncbi:MAG TPA: hypothetical protein VK668_12485 [Mucilaginibacter sp.]|nr:hypothetical protein [Mucilaginibacter sp.]
MRKATRTSAGSQQDAELQQLYDWNKQQLLTIVFLDDDAKIIKRLITKYYPASTDAIYINMLQVIISQLLQLDMVKANVARDILVCQKHLSDTINNTLPKSIEFLKLENERIDCEMTDLNKSFKHIRKDLLSFRKSSVHENSEYPEQLNNTTP